MACAAAGRWFAVAAKAVVALACIACDPASQPWQPPQPPGEAWAACLVAPKRACVLDEAIRAARAASSRTTVDEALDAIAIAHVGRGRFVDALAVSRLITDRTIRSIAGFRIARGQARAGQWDAALQVAQDVPERHWQAVAFGSVAEAYGRAGLAREAAAAFDRALRSARGAPGGDRASALRAVAISLAWAGRGVEAREIAGTITGHWRLVALVGIGEAQASVGATADAAVSFKDALAEAHGGGAVGSVYDLRDIGAGQAKAGLREDAAETFAAGLAASRAFGDRGSRDVFLAVIAEAQARAGFAAEALAVVGEMGLDWSRVRVAVAAAETQAAGGAATAAAETYRVALASAEEGREAARPFLLAFVGESQVANGLLAEAAATLVRAEKAALALMGEQRRSGLIAVARAQATAGGLAEARRLAETMSDAVARDTALGAIVEAALKVRLTAVALEAALAINDPRLSGYPLRLVADAQARAGQIADALRTVQAMLPIHYQRPYALGTIAAAMPD